MKRILSIALVLICLSCFVGCKDNSTNDTDSRLDSTDNTTIKASEGLDIQPHPDGGYAVHGIGSCTDTDIVIPQTYKDGKVLYIMRSAFKDCDNITSITVPDEFEWIGDAAFEGCTSLTSIKLPDTFPGFYTRSVFGKCSSLTEVVFPENTKYIHDFAFEGCTSLKSITLPTSLTEISNVAFSGANELKDVYYKGTKEQWKNVKIVNSYPDYQFTCDFTVHCTDGDLTYGGQDVGWQ